MRKLIVFNHLSLDGFFTDAHNDMSFTRNPTPDAEWDAFVESNAGRGGTLLFGRITYELMAGFWPTPMAIESMPKIAEKMNQSPKVVFSKSLEEATWNNTKLIKGNLVEEVRKLKDEPGDDIVIFGSGSLIPHLAQAGLIDEYQFVVDPVVLGAGRTLFAGIQELQPLKLKMTRTFANGNVLLFYEPAG